MAAIAVASVCGGGSSAFAQENVIKDWDGGVSPNGTPDQFGWTSSKGRTWNAENANSGIRFTTTYSGYKLEDGTSYTYSPDYPLSTKLLWIRYDTKGEYYTYKVTGLLPNHQYKFSGLVAWHNTNTYTGDPTYTISIKNGNTTIAKTSKKVSGTGNKQKLYPISFAFTASTEEDSETWLVFECDQIGDCIEALSALEIIEDYPEVKNLIAEANTVPGTHPDLQKAISDANSKIADGVVYDNYDEIVSSLKDAIASARNANKTEAIKTEGTEENPEDWTGAIANPSFEESESLLGTTQGGQQMRPAGWTESKTWGNAEYMYAGKSTDFATEESNSYKVRFNWSAGDTYTISQTITSLPRGKYKLTVDVKNSNASGSKSIAKLTVNDKEQQQTITSKTTLEQEFFLTEEGDVTIKLSSTHEKSGGGNGESILYWDNVRLYNYGTEVLVTDEDNEALNDAIAKAEGYILGFEEGEYAPYENRDAINALAKAKAIDQETNIFKSVVTEAKEALDNAQWTANTEALNAVYNGTFAKSSINADSGKGVDAPGWTHKDDDNFRRIIGDVETYPGLNETDGKKLAFVYGDTFIYGKETGYTMPLEAHTIYELTFKYAGWGSDGKGGNDGCWVEVVNADGKGMTTQDYGKATSGPANTEAWIKRTIKFVTDEAGDYQLKLTFQGNSAFTDIYLFKAKSQELVFTDGEALPSYAEGTYPTVKIKRTFTKDRWATAVYPFAIGNEDVEEIATLTSFKEGVLGFTTDEASVANKPCLIKANGEIVLKNVEVAKATAKETKAGDATFKGVYKEMPINSDATNAYYVLSSNALHRVSEKTETPATVGAYRAYIQVPAAAEVKERISVDGEATAIEDIEIAADKAVSGEIYNLAGQRVAQPTKGIYIVNGKKVLIK